MSGFRPEHFDQLGEAHRPWSEEEDRPIVGEIITIRKTPGNS
jgi:hypothetical protein